MMNAWKKFRRTLSAFRVAQAGNVAITFAFASLPIIGMVGAAIDYSRAKCSQGGHADRRSIPPR